VLAITDGKTKGEATVFQRPPTPIPMEGIETEAGSPSRGGPTHTAPTVITGESIEGEGPARAEEAKPLMANKLLQATLIHSRAAQDLLVQYAAEGDYGLMVLSEPYWVPPRNPMWAAARMGTDVKVAITWRRSENPLPCSTVLEAGEEFVAVRWGDITVVGVYLSPNLDRDEVKEGLGWIQACVQRCAPAPSWLQCAFQSVGFPAHELERHGPIGMGGVVAPTLSECGRNEHLRPAARG